MPIVEIKCNKCGKPMTALEKAFSKLGLCNECEDQLLIRRKNSHNFDTMMYHRNQLKELGFR